MPSASSGNVSFWRGCCLALASIAAIEALGLVLVARSLPAPPPAAGSNVAQILPATPPDAVAATPALTGAEAVSPRVPASSRAHALATRNSRQRARASEDRGISLAEKDPEAAFRALAELAPGADRNAMIRGIFEVLARKDAAQAIAYAKQTQPGMEREAALTTLLDRWKGGPADDSLPLSRARRIATEGLDAGLGAELLQGDSPQPDLAVLWAQELTARQGKIELLGSAAAVQVKTDPALAASYGSELEGKERLAFNDQLVSSWAQTQPEAAWQWSSALDDPDARTKAQYATIETQSNADPAGAAARLALLPDGTQRAETLRDVATNYANKNTDAALAWAQTLPPADAAVAGGAISSVTPVGVGVMLSQDNEGYPLVASVVPNFGAAQSGMIHEGDRIVGVSQGNGQFVDVQQLDIGQVTNLVRGSAGSLVQLQIAPALPGGSYGAPTVVPVIRQLIKHGG